MPSKGTIKPVTSSRNRVVGKTAAAKKAVLGRFISVTVGSVEVKVLVPSANELKKRVLESESVAGRIRTAIARPGVRLNVKASTPMYSADSVDPALIVRKVGTTTTRGRFDNNGVFRKVK